MHDLGRFRLLLPILVIGLFCGAAGRLMIERSNRDGEAADVVVESAREVERSTSTVSSTSLPPTTSVEATTSAVPIPPTTAADQTLLVNTAAVPADAVLFDMPSGNVACFVGSSSARCDIYDHSWDSPQAGCEGGGPQSATIVPGGSGRLTCYADSLALGNTPLAYGASITVGQLTCDSADTGVVCRDVDTGRGFRLARASYEVLGVGGVVGRACATGSMIGAGTTDKFAVEICETSSSVFYHGAAIETGDDITLDACFVDPSTVVAESDGYQYIVVAPVDEPGLLRVIDPGGAVIVDSRLDVELPLDVGSSPYFCE